MRRDVRHLRNPSVSVAPSPPAPLPPVPPPPPHPPKEKFPVVLSDDAPPQVNHPIPPMRPLAYSAIQKILRRSEITPFDPTTIVIVRRISPSLFFYCTQYVGYLVPVEGLESIFSHFQPISRHLKTIMSHPDGTEIRISGKDVSIVNGTSFLHISPYGNEHYEVFRTHYGVATITQTYGAALLAGFHPDPQQKTPPVEQCLFYNERLLEPVFGPDNFEDILAETHFYAIRSDHPGTAMYPVHHGQALCVFARHTQEWIRRPETPLHWHLG